MEGGLSSDRWAGLALAAVGVLVLVLVLVGCSIDRGGLSVEGGCLFISVWIFLQVEFQFHVRWCCTGHRPKKVSQNQAN